MGELVPVLCKKIVPSDEFRISISSLTRMSPMANPVFDRLRIDYDAFFVQNRIIDPQFKEFLTGGIGLYGQESTEGMRNIVCNISGSATAQTPADYFNGIVKKYFSSGTLFDYLGLRLYMTPNLKAAAFSCKFNYEPILGYMKIYEDWYRNERFQPAVYTNAISALAGNRIITYDVSYGGGLSDSFPLKIFRRNYAKDPFTTALAEPLIGGPIPIMEGTAPIYVNGQANPLTSGNTDTGKLSNLGNKSTPLSIITNNGVRGGDLFADLSAVASNTVQQLNQMYALYRFFMKDTYNGNRYVEFVQSHFNVIVPDSTLERPLFLGRVTGYVNFSEVYQTSASDNTTKQALGDYAGKGIAGVSGKLFHEKFLEHGYLYVIMSIVPDTTYFQGVSDIFFYGDRFESFFFPEFQNIGDAAIDRRKLFVPTVSVNSTYDFKISSNAANTFGFQRRNWEMIWYPNELHGYFADVNSMYNWTFARKFAAPPVLGDTFSAVPTINNPFTYVDEESMNYFTDILFNIDALRPVERHESITTH